MMRLSETQKSLLQSLDAKSKDSAADLALSLDIPAGPAARSAESLVKHGLLKVKTDKEGTKRYSRTAEGGKVAKKL
jgi:predicted ArsR family transcriptional regulator